MTGKLAGKTALITGGNSGIGKATALLFAREGAHVIVTGRDTPTLEQTHAELEAAKASPQQRMLALQSDAGSLVAIQTLMAQVKAQFDGIDVLFANAAVGRPAPLELVTEELFDLTVSVNLKGVFFTIQQALPLLREGASIIATTSISNQKGAPGFSVYAACKAGLRSFVQSLSLELAPRKIRINAISPGPIDTPGFGRWDVPQEVVQAARQQLEGKSPLGRFGESDEIAKAALFLASSDASYIVGTELVVDGGISLPL